MHIFIFHTRSHMEPLGLHSSTNDFRQLTWLTWPKHAITVSCPVFFTSCRCGNFLRTLARGCMESSTAVSKRFSGIFSLKPGTNSWKHHWLVVSSHLKNISQWGWLYHIIPNIWEKKTDQFILRTWNPLLWQWQYTVCYWSHGSVKILWAFPIKNVWNLVDLSWSPYSYGAVYQRGSISSKRQSVQNLRTNPWGLSCVDHGTWGSLRWILRFKRTGFTLWGAVPLSGCVTLCKS